MNKSVESVVTSLASRGLTEAASGVILGAYLQQTPDVTDEYKQQVLVTLLVLQRKKEQREEAQMLELIQLFGLTADKINEAAQAALKLTEPGESNG